MKATTRAVVSVAIVVLGCSDSRRSSELEDRRAVVASTGSAVMPFDLDRTTHVFQKTDVGGRQEVYADSDDQEQVALIRAHLRDEAERFSNGDFHHPEMIHGEGMPGLHELVAGYERLSVEYSETDRGAQILYTTTDTELVPAVHAWFDAQLLDHGEHATAGS